MAITLDGPATNLRKRKSVGTLKAEQKGSLEVDSPKPKAGDAGGVMRADDILNGRSTALMKVNAVPTEHGQEMDKKLDEHHSSVAFYSAPLHNRKHCAGGRGSMAGLSLCVQV